MRKMPVRGQMPHTMIFEIDLSSFDLCFFRNKKKTKTDLYSIGLYSIGIVNIVFR